MPIPRKTPPTCPVELTISVVAGRWKARIIYQLLRAKEPNYGELRDRVEGIMDRVLTQQLNELKSDGIVSPRREGRLVRRYGLTKSGDGLIPIFLAMQAWGLDRQAVDDTPDRA